MKCLDTYPLVEIFNGNPGFSHLLNEDIVITDLTMAEFYSLLYRDQGSSIADYWHKKLSFHCKPVPRETLLKAVRFRQNNKKQNLSFFDCVGYMFALDNRMIFVTGDKEFENKEGVEFIK